MEFCFGKFYWSIYSVCHFSVKNHFEEVILCNKGIKFNYALTLLSTWDIMSIVNIFSDF
jgi:hypothetical protein